ncbi:DASH family cryptochrome [Gramella sp. GC03-9]|uniref:Cryptochrome DASH n=2 Tax=Christiangramia oceanisediminis TaxID=2920386 RepID=A0A9X2KZY4_9FLAO|nr:DASH family cryptochrome [Gramella oceanisediminis]MCP9201422.1 DASH family cryptochrome [Gramella oceanisediminis]
MGNALVWFRNDLRIHDQEALASACNQNERVLAAYFFDPRHYQVTEYGFKKTGKFRARFLIESIHELKKNLEKLNINLMIFEAEPEEKIPELVSKFEISDIYFQKEWTSEEKEVEDSLKDRLENVQFHSYFQQFLFHPEDLAYDDYQEIPEVFTEFRKKQEKQSKVRELFPVPEARQEKNMDSEKTEIPGLKELGLEEFEQDERTAFPFQGGEEQAKKRVKEYFWTSRNLLEYKKTRNGLIGEEYSSKLSAWLANGSISPRYIYHEVKKFENKIRSNESTYWLIFELIWRDYFKYMSLKHGNDFFKLGGIKKKKLDWNNDKESLDRWIDGETKEAFVNANMKEIAATGFMSNRGRQNVNSFWAKELKQDWRIGAAYFESLLIDYDVHSNWGNWMYNSGVGNDPRDRKFNIKSQANRYDADNEYQDLWLKN